MMSLGYKRTQQPGRIPKLGFNKMKKAINAIREAIAWK
jgi:hypothetical protein